MIDLLVDPQALRPDPLRLGMEFYATSYQERVTCGIVSRYDA